MPQSEIRTSYNLLPLSLLAMLALGACVDEPTAPEAPGTSVAPQLNTISKTHELQPLPGTSEIEIADVSDTPSIIGTSGGLPAEWNPEGLPTAWATLPGSDQNRPHAISSFHRTIGEARINGEYHAVMWNSLGTTVTDLGIVLPPDEEDRHLSTADLEVAGTMLDAASQRQAFHWSQGTTTPLEPLAGDTESMAYGVDIFGRVAGVSLGSSSESAGTIVVWPAGGGAPAATQFDAVSYHVAGVSARGRIVISARDGGGVHIWEDGVVTRLPNPSEDQGGLYEVTAVAPGARMVGWTGDPQRPRYGIWQIDGTFDAVRPGWVCDAIDSPNPRTAWLGCTGVRSDPFLAIVEIDPWLPDDT